MIYALVIDSSGNGIGSHAYAEAPASYPANETECTQAQAANPTAWKVSSGSIVATPVPVAQQAAALLTAGLTITSTSTPALDGTYATTSDSQQHIQAEVIALLLNGAFTDGSSTVAWLDASGAAHTFDVAQFKAFATAVAAFVSGCLKCINGQAAALPSASATIP